jgi:ABC-type phosphate/phosphonate transport system substrate-binding protein
VLPDRDRFEVIEGLFNDVRFFSRISFLLHAAVLFIHLLLASVDMSFAQEPGIQPFRIGFSGSMFTEVNENDAKAAMRVWGQTVARNRGIPVEPDVAIFKDIQAMLNSLMNKELDAAAVSIIEYSMLRQKVDFAPIFLTHHNREYAEEYLLMVHRNGPVQRLEDLEGRHIQIHTHLRACLAPLWLDTLLVENGFKPAEAFAGKITRTNRLSKTLLPVFFRQVDACVVTRRGFETMAELNPQLGNQLTIIFSSEQMVPAVFAFRHDYEPPYMTALLDGILDLHKTPAGQQVLMIFKSDKIEKHPEASLSIALELIATHKRLVLENQPP